MQEDQPLFDWQKIKATVSNRKNIVQATKTIVFYLTIYIVFLVLVNRFDISAESVQETFAGLGAYLVPVFIGVQLLVSLTPLPDLPFIAAGVLFFQPWAAFLMLWLGMWLGTVINFNIARRLGYNYVHKHYPQTASWIDRFAGKYWFETVVVGRTFSIVTFDLVAYAAGVSSLSFKKFAFASVFSIVPVALNALLVGLAVTAGNLSKTALYAGLTGLLAIALGIVARLISKRWEKTSSKRASKLHELPEEVGS